MSGQPLLASMRLKSTRQSNRTPGFAGLAFDQLSAGLQRFLLRRVRNEQSAKDLEQEVYLRLLRIANEELVRSPEAYVYRIASNLIGQAAAQDRVPVQFDSEAAARAAEQLHDDSPPPEDIYDEQEREQRLAQIVAQLPAMQKAVFMLARYQGLSHAEIAGRFGISVHTVKKHMLRAICHCRQALTNQDGTGS